VPGYTTARHEQRTIEASRLDTISEHQVRFAQDELIEDRSTIVIAHRLAERRI